MKKKSGPKVPTYVISLGGSLIVPGDIDHQFLKGFVSLISRYEKKGIRFIIVAGGGKTARLYQKGLKLTKNKGLKDLDWIGIYATHLNAQLLRLLFGNLAQEQIIKNPNVTLKWNKRVVLAGGWEPGRSTDDVAVRFALQNGARVVINLSNIDYLYDQDPRKHPDAKKVSEITWQNLRKIVGRRWVPGANVPFDPTAALTAMKNGICAVIASGHDLSNLENIINNKPYKGTTIK
jgi:uridylate kinase